MPRPWQPAPSFPPAPVVELQAGAEAAPEPPSDDAEAASAGLAESNGRGHRLLVAGLVVVALALAGSTGYLYRTSHAWQDRADRYETASSKLGTDLASTRRDLTDAQSELDAVRSQLATAQVRIVQLANEKAQVGDDREAQRLLADYQARVSAAAGRVALSLDQCVKGQNQLISYLGTPDLYDKAALDQYATSVTALCTAATDANDALQTELGR